MTDARLGELDDDLVEPDRRLLYLKYCFDGASSLDELAADLRTFAADLDRRVAGGWRLDEPVASGWANLVRSAAPS